MDERPRLSPDDAIGWLIVGHGTRDPRGGADFLTTVDQVARDVAPVPVEPCFLELAQPNIARGIERLAARGVRRLRVVPLLLFTAGHARHDIPQAVARGCERWPGMTWEQTPTLDAAPSLAELSARRFQEAWERHDAGETSPPVWVLIGRGNREPEALDQLAGVARRRLSPPPIARVELGFMALARPTLEESLAAAVEGGERVKIVQPHLLFQGQLIETLRERVESWRRRDPGGIWLLADPLGPHPLLVRAVRELAERFTPIGQLKEMS